MTERWRLQGTAAFAVVTTLLSVPLTGHAAEQSGIAVAVIPATQAAGETGTRRLQTQAPVFRGDVIATGPSGEAQVRLLDQTKLVVGPNSRLEIDNFIYSGNGAAQQVSINAVRGAFRFITGHSQKTAYTIKTPTATIGVRGTEFDFNVDSAGGMEMALYSGWAQICDPQRRRRCVDVWGACSVAVSPPGQRARRVTDIDDCARSSASTRRVAERGGPSVPVVVRCRRRNRPRCLRLRIRCHRHPVHYRAIPVTPSRSEVQARLPAAATLATQGRARATRSHPKPHHCAIYKL
jgi:hypothetical protein